VKSNAVRLSYVPVVAALLVLTGCANGTTSTPEEAGICVDEATNVRIDDDRCGDFIEHGHSTHSGTYVMWMSTSSSHTVPATGSHVPSNIGHRNTIPSGKVVAKGLPSSGGQMSAISRGGFGISGAKGSAGS
jgi:hypothetical protein